MGNSEECSQPGSPCAASSRTHAAVRSFPDVDPQICQSVAVNAAAPHFESHLPPLPLLVSPALAAIRVENYQDKKDTHDPERPEARQLSGSGQGTHGATTFPAKSFTTICR